MVRPPLSRVAGFGLGAAVAFVILGVEIPPARPLWLGLAAIAGIAGAIVTLVALRQASASAVSDEAAIRAKLQKAVDRVNAELSVVEKVRRFALADEAFSVDNEQMTPSLKIRRHVLKQAYGERLDALYGK